MNKIKTRPLEENNHAYRMPPKEKVIFSLISGVLLMLASYLFFKSLLVSVLSILILPILSKYHEARLALNRKRELNYQFRDVLYSVSSSIATGRHLPEALSDAKDHMILIYGEDGLMVQELVKIAQGFFESKDSEEQILLDFSRRTGLEDIANFVEIYFTCRSTGGDMEHVIIKAADSIVEKISIHREIQMLTTQKKFEGKLLTGLPFLVIGFLEITSPDYLSVMYETAIGRVLMATALFGIAVAYYITSKITEIEI